ncbi:MAG: Gfo/Idh/MocA family oxidoreductase [Gemmatimonadales bacterium]|nr:Gfo/Idh/MocA family oxidoreductase [Gemmatimonadota bacterium]MDX2056843.1 Gfo/Idh/MocA family oxidoreductase [Gemmatimonadales bacterium]
MPRHRSRRQFLTDTAGLAWGAAIVPRHVLGRGFQAPSDTLNVAIVGAGGMGMSNAEQLLSQNIVALCDVDFGYVDRSLLGRVKPANNKPGPNAEKLGAAFQKATRYGDFRDMLARHRDLDAVLIATPDHLHAPIAKAAMEAGKHVYVQKPLTYSVHEARVLAATAKRTGVVTQMGNQGHSSDDARLINEWVQAGVIGPVREVHVWTNRPIWPQGVPRPASLPADFPGLAKLDWWGQWAMNSIVGNALAGDFPAPPGLDWKGYLGPVPADYPYHPAYHPFRWRGWVDFGVSALGDMGAHLVDHPFWALDLDYPTTIEATSTPWGGTEAAPATYPQAMLAHYQFPAKGSRPPVTMTWYDGGLMPPRPAALPDDVALDREGGVIFVGDRGILLHGTYGAKPTLFPESLRPEAAAVPKTMPRIVTSHEMNWANACKGQGSPTCPIDYAARLTEVMLLGVVALRAGQGVKLHYDGAAMKITNHAQANRYLTREYRAGWSV